MKNFTLEDFSGSGQYLVRISTEQKSQIEKGQKPHVFDTGYLSTIMYKVGWLTNNFNIGEGGQVAALISMADGMITICDYPIPGEFTKIIWEGDNQKGKLKLIDYLNTGTEEYRFATQEEVVRVVMYQKSRWKN